MLMLTDGMITDYSSVMFDYLLLNKPICFTVDDMDSYKLGFVDNYEELLAGDKIMDINQLIQFILNVSEGVDPFNYKRNELNKKLNKYGMDGKNSERICKYLGIE
jgi:CDP-glycerol glycerophosphotransferase (TagB/SpsB family)